uniref:(northern house mosquito) hypothetical protein n=1 Tax=Culex pipiens TaxID=7175 RepID=A0A8D8BNP9_CULPI
MGPSINPVHRFLEISKHSRYTVKKCEFVCRSLIPTQTTFKGVSTAGDKHRSKSNLHQSSRLQLNLSRVATLLPVHPDFTFLPVLLPRQMELCTKKLNYLCPSKKRQIFINKNQNFLNTKTKTNIKKNI